MATVGVKELKHLQGVSKSHDIDVHML